MYHISITDCLSVCVLCLSEYVSGFFIGIYFRVYRNQDESCTLAIFGLCQLQFCLLTLARFVDLSVCLPVALCPSVRLSGPSTCFRGRDPQFSIL